MVELYLVRHPRTDANKSKIVQGTIDSKLEKGWETEADLTAKFLAERGSFDAVFTSDLSRADITGRRVVDYLRRRQEGPLEYHSIPDLRERHWGKYQGKPYEEVPHGSHNILDYLFLLDSIAKGENLSAVRERIERFRREHFGRFDGSSARVGIVGHSYWLNYFRNLVVDGSVIGGNGYVNLPHLSVRLLEFYGSLTRDKGLIK